MAYVTHILLGKITKVHGYEGAVTIRLERDLSEDITLMESVFIEIDGRPVPFFIDTAEQPDNLTIRLKFSGYDSGNRIREFIGCRVFLTKASRAPRPDEVPQDLIDYDVYTDSGILAGRVTEIIENPGQLLISIVSDAGKEILLPLHEDLIESVDTEKKIIRMIIPEGLLDIN